MTFSENVEKWIKRLNRKGPFYLYETEQGTTVRWDHSNYNPETKTGSVKTTVPKKSYYVIWNDDDKTKFGSFSDYMLTRHGVATRSVLNGDTMFDLWNGSGLDQTIFDEMLKVRKRMSGLPHFDIRSLVGIVS